MENINGTNKNIEEQAKVIGEIFENKQGQNQVGNIGQGYNANIGQEYAEGTVGNISGIYQGQEGFGIVGTQNGNLGQKAENMNKEFKEEAGCVDAIAQVQTGYVGGFIGNIGQKIGEKTSNYIGGLVEEPMPLQGNMQNIGVEEIQEENYSKNLPVKQGFFGKVVALITGKTKVQLEISQKEEKVLTEVHDFLFQNMSIKGFLDILKIGNDKNKNK